jgi:hypothetical protein
MISEQLGAKSLEVAGAEYGLGAFATQSIKKGEYIGGNMLLFTIPAAECSATSKNT